MRFLNTKIAILALGRGFYLHMCFHKEFNINRQALAQACNSLKAIILADTNRDRIVDIDGDTDVKDKGNWTLERGALSLAKIGDTNQRCSKKITANTTNEEFDSCNGASGTVQRSPKYLAPLRTIPTEELSSDALGSIYVDEDVAEMVRIFIKANSDWVFVGAGHTFTAEELKDG